MSVEYAVSTPPTVAQVDYVMSRVYNVDVFNVLFPSYSVSKQKHSRGILKIHPMSNAVFVQEIRAVVKHRKYNKTTASIGKNSTTRLKLLSLLQSGLSSGDLDFLLQRICNTKSVSPNRNNMQASK